MQMSRCIKIGISLILIMIMFAGCKNMGNRADYITITNTHATANEELVMDVIEYDLYNQSVSKIVSIPYTSQYPLAVYSASEDKVYYTALSEDGKGDELFVMDCESNEVSQLTNEFFAINNIYSIDEGIFIAGVRRSDDTAVRPYIYDRETKEVKEITIPNDFYIACAHYDPVKQDLYVSGYLEEEDRKAFDAEEDGDIKGITNYVYKLDGDAFKLIYTKKDCYIKSITSCNNDLIIKWGATYFDEEMKLTKFSRSKKVEEAFHFEKSEIKNMVDDSLVYADEDEIFYIRQIEKEDDEDDIVYQLCNYDCATGQITVLYEAPTESAINNAQVLIKQ